MRSLVLALLLVLFASGEAKAQCGAKRSSCSGCHDGAHAALPADGAWHANHAFADVCTACHGGNGESSDVTAAHRDLTAPLADVPARCGCCHGAAATELATRYALEVEAGDAGAGASPATSAPTPHPHGDPGPNLVLACIIVAAGAADLLLAVRLGRRRVEVP